MIEMNGFTKCPNGHYYRSALDECPYCKNVKSSTGVGTGSSTRPVDEHTEAYASPTPPIGTEMGYETEVFDGGFGTGQQQSSSQSPSRPHAPVSGSCTEFIDEPLDTNGPIGSENKQSQGNQQNSFGNGCNSQPHQPRYSRKLVGWLVNYTLDPMGVDFRIYEGRNIIGRDSDCNITINDGTVTGRHATILFRNGKYLIQDNLSTHGTFVNGLDIDQNPWELNDGDTIMLGRTMLKFRSAL